MLGETPWMEDGKAKDYVREGDNNPATTVVKGTLIAHTMRGGFWNNPDQFITSAFRIGLRYDAVPNATGFRLVRMPK